MGWDDIYRLLTEMWGFTPDTISHMSIPQVIAYLSAPEEKKQGLTHIEVASRIRRRREERILQKEMSRGVQAS